MKLRGKAMGERHPGMRAKELVGKEPVEEPLEFDLGAVVSRLKAEGYEGEDQALQGDHQLLLPLVGQPYLDQLHKFISERLEAEMRNLNFRLLHHEHLLSLVVRAKLAGLKDFNKKTEIEGHLKNQVGEQIKLLGMEENEPWKIPLEYLILFPEKREDIRKVLKPFVSQHLLYLRSQIDPFPTSIDWEEIVAMKLLFPENKEITMFIRHFWPKWTQLLNSWMAKEKKQEVENQPLWKVNPVIALACALHILAAEKAIINDQGLPEVTHHQPAFKPSARLPERDLAG